MIGNLFLGEAGGARLLEANQGSHDDGVKVLARLETTPAGPGVGGEAIFTALYLGVTWTAEATIDVTPIISGANDDGTPFEVELEVQQVTLPANAVPLSMTRLLGLSVPLVVDGVERLRQAPRATWFRARLEALVHDEGDLIFEGIGVEMEVVRESLVAQALAPVPSGS